MIPPFTIETLAAHWSCSESFVRNLIKDGKLNYFRLGILIRIKPEEVEKFECQNTVFSDSEEDSPSFGMTVRVGDVGMPSLRPIGLERRQRLGSGGGSETTSRGQRAA